LNAVPEMLDVVAVAEHGIGRKDVKFGYSHFVGKRMPWVGFGFEPITRKKGAGCWGNIKSSKIN
jgi:hypothetical protein